MKIAVIGAGAIGSLVAGYLKLKNEDVVLAGHAESVSAIKEKGLEISGTRGRFNVTLDVSERLSSEAGLIILATKTQDIEGSLKDNLKFVQDAIILTTQNGVAADEIAAGYLPKENIISSIVMFGSTYLSPAKVVHNFEGSWIVGRIFHENDLKAVEITRILNTIFPAILSEDIKGMKYLKIFVNANNCIPAILGMSMQEAFSDPAISRISMHIWKEGLGLVKKAGISLGSLPDFPLERLTKLTALPDTEGAKVFSGIMSGLSKEPLYGSILQSIKRNRPSEIDFINGEFVRIAKDNHGDAPLNEKLVGMVHEVEKTKRFFSKKELIESANKFLS